MGSVGRNADDTKNQANEGRERDIKESNGKWTGWLGWLDGWLVDDRSYFVSFSAIK